ILEGARARLDFSKTQSGLGAKRREPHRLSIEIRRVLVSLQALVGNAEIIGSFGIGCISGVHFRETSKSLLESIQAGIEASRGLQQLKTGRKFQQRFLISLNGRQRIAIQ